MRVSNFETTRQVTTPKTISRIRQSDAEQKGEQVNPTGGARSLPPHAEYPILPTFPSPLPTTRTALSPNPPNESHHPLPSKRERERESYRVTTEINKEQRRRVVGGRRRRGV